MGQKVNSVGFRLGYVGKWKAQWVLPKKKCPSQLEQDVKVRAYVLNKLSNCGLESCFIECTGSHLILNLSSSKPGFIIGKKGVEVDKMKKELSALTNKTVFVNVSEVKKSETSAALIAESLGGQIGKRVKCSKAVNGVITACMRCNVVGIKVVVSGRLDGADIARREKFLEGCVPLQTLRADIDYGFFAVKTIYGIIGIKVWVCFGQIYDKSVLYEKNARA